jgi:hypothetical protein
LEEYAAGFDDLFTHVAQRRGFREYLAGLLAPRDRNKTLTGLAGAGDGVEAVGRADVPSPLNPRRAAASTPAAGSPGDLQDDGRVPRV